METAQSTIKYTPRTEGLWEIPGVIYQGETGTYRLFEEMTPTLNQDQLAELYTKEKQKGNHHPTDMPLVWAIATRAYELRDEDQSKTLQQFLRSGLRTFPNTLTRIIYNSSGEDRVIHNYGTSDEYSLQGDIVGSGGFVSELSDKTVLEKIIGTQDTQKINEISQYVNGTDTYLWRLNSKPKQKDERVARFDAIGGRLGLDCCRHPRDEGPAFRVLRVE